MGTGKLINLWTVITILLAAIIIIGGIVTWTKYGSNHPIEISTVPVPELQGEIYIGGAVNNPGIYPLKPGDSLKDLIQAAGGSTDGGDISRISLHIPAMTGETHPQKINLNQAEAWLLQALPGIGEARAQTIINYRQQNGPFHNINELSKVEGIGSGIYEKIKDLITVTD